MEFNIDKQTFLHGLYKVQGIVDKKSTLNVLSHVLITSTSEGTIRLTSTDYDVVLLGSYNAEVVKAGSMAVNGRSLFDVVKSLPDEPIRLRSLENHWVELHCGRSSFKLTGIPAEDFPAFQEDVDISTFKVSKAVIRSMIDKTAFSVSNDESRLNLNGVFFRVQPDGEGNLKLTMASTDGHRLSKVEETIENSGWEGDSAEAIIHKKGVFELKRMLDGEDEDTFIGFHHANIVFKNDGDTMFVRQIEESFPDYTKVIPQSNSTHLTVPRTMITNAVRRTATLTSSKTSIIRLELSPGNLVLSTSNPEAGESRDELDVVYQGDTMAIGFNYRYLLDVLSVVGGDEIRFEINDQFSPGVIRSEEDANAIFVIMPMRI